MMSAIVDPPDTRARDFSLSEQYPFSMYDIENFIPDYSIVEEDNTGSAVYKTAEFRSPQEVAAGFNIENYNGNDILLFVGPARNGTTAMGLAMAGSEAVTYSYFQPFKDLLRGRADEVLLPPEPTDGVLFLKETFGPEAPEELFDPVEILKLRGIPIEKISIIYTLRNPFNTFRSLGAYVNDGEGRSTMDINYYIEMQNHVLALFDKHRRELGADKVIPFSYDLFEEGRDREIMAQLARRVPIEAFDGDTIPLEFQKETLRSWELGGEMVWGEARARDYWDDVIKPILSRGEFRYRNGTVKPKNIDLMTDDQERMLEEHCLPGYQRFLEQARKEMYEGHASEYIALPQPIEP